MAQTNYSFSTPIGEAGGILDIAPYAVNSFVNEEETGTLKFGVGVVKGTAAGTQIKLPTSSSTAADFEGVVTNRRTTEYDLEGTVHIRKNAATGIMSYGRIYVRVANGVSPAYGEMAYVLNSGDEAGYFTNVSTNAFAVNARFVGTVDSARGIAAVELYNQANK